MRGTAGQQLATSSAAAKRRNRTKEATQNNTTVIGARREMRHAMNVNPVLKAGRRNTGAGASSQAARCEAQQGASFILMRLHGHGCDNGGVPGMGDTTVTTTTGEVGY